MKQTLLEMTQDILSDMSDDEVNSIDDTFDSQQVATIIRSSYLAMMSNRNWPHQRKLLQIYPTSSIRTPTHMVMQEGVKEMCFLNYNCAKQGETRLQFKPMQWLEPEDFIRHLNTRRSDDSNVDTIIDESGVQLFIINDKAPTYYTSFDDKVLVFDSYDKGADNSLQESKIQAMAYVMPYWEHIDSYIPDLPSEAFAALLAEAKSSAMLRLKQTQDVKAETEARRQQSWLSRKAWRAKGGVQYPDYGRKRR